MHADLPSGFKQGKDIIKVFGTVNQTNFRWLELPPLDQSMRGRKRSITSNQLEVLMETITSDRPVTKGVKPSSIFNEQWTTAQIEVEIHSSIKVPNVKVFISYAREDADKATMLYQYLKAAGLDPWLDKESILPGQQWKSAIRNAIKDSRYFIALLSSNSIEKRGFGQRELRETLQVLDELPRAETSVIPVRLDESKIKDERLNKFHPVDLFPDWNKGVQKILSSMNIK